MVLVVWFGAKENVPDRRVKPLCNLLQGFDYHIRSVDYENQLRSIKRREEKEKEKEIQYLYCSH